MTSHVSLMAVTTTQTGSKAQTAREKTSSQPIITTIRDKTTTGSTTTTIRTAKTTT